MNPALRSTFDLDYFATLPKRIREEVMLWIKIIEQVEEADSLEKGAAVAATKWSHIRGTSKNNIKRKVRAYRKHGWQALINKAKVGKQNAAMSIGEHFRRYCEQNQRSSNEAYRSMMCDFHAGKYFEDVGSWREVYAAEFPDRPTPYNCPLDFIPHGWSYSNLMRSCGLTKYEIKAARIGRGAARDLLPSVHSTRVNLAVGQIYMFDDMWHDAKVNYPGNRKAQRVIELAAVDVFSACRFAYGMQPRKENIDTGRMQNLNETHMRQLLAHVLINIGYHPDGATFVVEHGTAAAGNELEQLIRNLSEGVVRFERSGIISDPIHKGLYCGQPRGNYKRKAALESQHSLAHTVAAAIKGQIGQDRDHSPEQMYGLEQYNNQLIKAAAALPPERARLLMMPLLDFSAYRDAIADLYREMNFRTWHNLEGWDEAGLVTTEYRLAPDTNDWFPADRYLDMPEEQRVVLYDAIQSIPELSRVRRLSPQEVFNAGKNDLVRLPKSCMPQILGERLAIQKKIRDDRVITYSNKAMGQTEFRYLAHTIKDAHGYDVALKPGTEVVIHINPFNCEECFVSDAESGAYIGLAKRWQTVSKIDVAALERQAGKQAHIEAELRAPIARRGAKLIKEKSDMHRHNAAVMRGDAVTDEELDREARDMGTEITDEEREAVLVRRPEETPEFSEEEISSLLQSEDDDQEQDYSDLF